MYVYVHTCCTHVLPIIYTFTNIHIMQQTTQPDPTRPDVTRRHTMPRDTIQQGTAQQGKAQQGTAGHERYDAAQLLLYRALGYLVLIASALKSLFVSTRGLKQNQRNEYSPPKKKV